MISNAAGTVYNIISCQLGSIQCIKYHFKPARGGILETRPRMVPTGEIIFEHPVLLEDTKHFKPTCSHCSPGNYYQAEPLSIVLRTYSDQTTITREIVLKDIWLTDVRYTTLINKDSALNGKRHLESLKPYKFEGE